MALILFNTLSKKDKTDAIEKLISHSTPSSDFFFMTVLSVLMATFGILLDSIAVVIGSMLIAPLLSPILSLSLGVIMSDFKLISRSTGTIGKSMLLAIASAAVATLLFGNGANGMLMSVSEPSFLYVAVAIVAGFAATFALVKPKLNETLPGVAIAVALIPPLALMGVGIATWSWVMISGSFIIFLLNAIGIIFASMVTFSLMNFYIVRRIARETVNEEDEKLKKEQQDAENSEKYKKSELINGQSSDSLILEINKTEKPKKVNTVNL